MDERNIQQILIEILYAAVNEQANSPAVAEKLTPDVVLSVYRLAKKHDLGHLVAEFVYQNKIAVDGELKATLQKVALTAVYRCERMRYAFAQICNAFEEAGIAYIPLKGSVLRPYYPQESMRTSCDIDILIHEEDIDRAVFCLTGKGFTFNKRNYHDVSLFSPNKIHLELHFSILEDKDFLDVVLKDAWQYAIPEKGCRYGFKKEFFVFHMYAHMAYHFLSGGCGIRSLVDIWIMENKMDAPYSCAKELLKKAGILKFAKEMSSLASRCFTENSRDAFSDMVLEYIYRGGVYGSLENSIAVQREKQNSPWSYFLGRLFPPRRTMTHAYPVLKKAPLLLPVFWVVRWIQALFAGKSKRFAREMSCAGNVTQDRIEEVKALRARLGL